MNHLCYINIFDYRNLHNVDMTFDSRYDFSLDRKRNVLSIEKRKGVADGFWGKNVYSLTAIVGNNGAGKSTALRFILEALVEGSGSRKELKGMIVTVDDEEGFSIYVPEELQRVYRCNVKGVIIDSIDKGLYTLDKSLTTSIKENPRIFLKEKLIYGFAPLFE